ncbi:hypothetical protein BP5796_01127 [Coleophoma crateriformis]|uniref:Phytocyanin domain-containing protein n=1 Tax=Coleophoma crateriformis TaxID=565419 RepID=A0A3D8TA18_9HELO|nr:hypothetical protein BP5796_01127 [Coleophoma crateriformis]
MYTRSLFFSLLPVALCQYGGGGAGSSTTATAAAAVASGSIQTVSVGEDGLVFTPNTLTAAVGSMVQFEFYPPSHSVAQSSFENPCAPLNSSAFFSGGFTTTGNGPNATTFTITINDTSPIWFYCGFPTHCETGMAGVINPPSNTSQTLAMYQAAAAAVGNTTRPPAVQGGVIGPAAAVSSGTSTSTSATATATSTSGATAEKLGRVDTVTSGFIAMIACAIAAAM